MEKSDTDNVVDNDDDKAEDFEINDYRGELESDESYEDYEENEGDNADEYVGPVLPGGHRFDKKLLCIRYPGIVVNTEKAMETLGGIAAISTAFDTPNRRLELRFRPQDGYRKPACGDRHHTAGFLIRVRVKKSRLRQMEENEQENIENLNYKGPFDLSTLDKLLGNLGKEIKSDSGQEKIAEMEMDGNKIETKSSVDELIESVKDKCNVIENPIVSTEEEIPTIREREISKSTEKFVTGNDKEMSSSSEKMRGEDLSNDENYQVPSWKVLGRVETEFDFQNLCDFQYLPITKSVTDPNVEEYIYESIYPAEIPPYRWLKNKVPYFLPPPAFSRMDSVQQFSLKPESDKGPTNVIGKTRKRRAGFSNFINFTSPETPCEPPPGIETAMQIKFLKKSHVEIMKNIFKERPIWSKNALLCVTDFTNDQLKILLPAVAYYFMTGPWRIMWVRLGYDPRKDPLSRKYQTLDYRLKAMHGLESTVNCKRRTAEYTLPYKSVSGIRSRATILTSMDDQAESRKKDRRLNEDTYIYREGVVPPSRQMFYQYCDVHDEEIQQMLAKLPVHLPGAKCHEKRGWLPIGFSDQCREIIKRQVRAVLRKQMNIPEDHPTALPPKRVIKKNVRLSKLTIDELSKKNRKAKRKDPEDPDDEEAKETKKKKKSVASTT